MKVHLDCIPCLQRQALQAARFVTDNESVQLDILKSVMNLLIENLENNVTTFDMATKIQSIVKRYTNREDPYYNVKKEYNKIALDLVPKLKSLIRNAKDPLHYAIKLSIAGNIIDFGAFESFELDKTIENVIQTPLTLDSYPRFKKELQSAKNLLYLVDNTGEIVFDKLLIDLILSSFNLDFITIVVKGKPFLNDATLEDVKEVGYEDLRNVRFFKVGVGIPDSGPHPQSAEFLKLIDQHDLIISKGQGNFEVFYDHSKIFFLLMAKCKVVANHLNVPVGSTIFYKANVS
ncbi:MAG: damage-control phosphatase ARMT1 family protein [Candidatus Hodarchaeales archaeon]